MSDFHLTNKVVQDNNLIQAINKLDRTTFKIFEMAVSCIDIKNPKQEVVLNKQDIFNFFETKSTAKHTLFKDHMKRLSQQGIMIQVPERKKEGFVNVTSQVLWGTDDSDNEVLVRFNDLIMPYLIDLRTNFTQYQITEIKGLNSKYSLILFKWLMMKYNAYQSSPEISMIELRELTDTVNEYSQFRDFDRYVLKVAEKEINQYTTLKISYDKIARKGRKITSIQWHISEKDTSKAIDVTPEAINSASNDLNGLYALFSFELHKDLSEADKTLIRALYEQYGYDNVIDALRQAIIKQTTSLRYIEKVLKGETNKQVPESQLDSEQQMTVDDFLVNETQAPNVKKSKWKFWKGK